MRFLPCYCPFWPFFHRKRQWFWGYLKKGLPNSSKFERVLANFCASYTFIQLNELTAKGKRMGNIE